MEPRRHLDGVAMEPKTAPSAGVRPGSIAAIRPPCAGLRVSPHCGTTILPLRSPQLGKEISEYWPSAASRIMSHAMDTMNADTAQTPHADTEAELRDRIAWEAEGIAEARADVAAGRMVDAAKVRAWVDSLRTDKKLPVPYSGR